MAVDMACPESASLRHLQLDQYLEKVLFTVPTTAMI